MKLIRKSTNRKGLRCSGLIAIIGVIALTSACGSSSKSSGSATPATKSTSVDLQLDFSWVADHTPFIQAQDDGSYKAQGLNVKLQQGQGSGTTMTLVGQGTAPFGWGDLSSAALAISKGVPIQVVAVITQQTPFGTECFKNVNFKSPKDLEGHSVILIPQESTAQLWPAYLKLNGVDASKVKVVNATFANKFTLFAQHKADCMPDYYGIGLDLTRYLNPDIGDPIAWQDNGVNVLSQGLVVNTSYAAKHPDVVKAFVAASLSAWQKVCDNPQTGADFFVQKHPEVNKTDNDKKLTLARIQYECQATKPKTDPNAKLGSSTDAQWTEMLNTLHKYGGMEQQLAPSAYYTNQYLPS